MDRYINSRETFKFIFFITHLIILINSEDDMPIIYYLGDLLSEKIGISASASRGLIKLSIKEEFGPFKPISDIGLKDYQDVINNSLKLRLQDLKISNFEEIVNLLLKELITHQSLVTMEKV